MLRVQQQILNIICRSKTFLLVLLIENNKCKTYVFIENRNVLCIQMGLLYMNRCIPLKTEILIQKNYMPISLNIISVILGI